MMLSSGTRQPRIASAHSPAQPKAIRQAPTKRLQHRLPALQASNQRETGGGFWTGFALGGAIFGAAGFFFAPQISRAILNEQQKFRLPKWLEEDKPPVTKAELEEKIGQLHSAINEVSASIGSDNPPNPSVADAPAGPASNSTNKDVDMIQQ